MKEIKEERGVLRDIVRELAPQDVLSMPLLLQRPHVYRPEG